MVWQGNYTSLFIGGEWVEPAPMTPLESCRRSRNRR